MAVEVKSMNGVPWVEKYRPNDFSSIVLDETNKEILSNILKFKYFPNLLLYGPPGTGKTTTIINMVKAYQQELGEDINKGSMIHLNASDERGIDIIRNQINQFVNSKGLFSNGMKFVILDEVDYMTKNAQLALRCLLNTKTDNVRYCLICNYISRIDESLQNDFIRLRFNKLPVSDILKFLNNIVVKEQLTYTHDNLKQIQMLYKSDIRSMINYMQSNQNIIKIQKIATNKIWENLLKMFENNENHEQIYRHIYEISNEYNIEIKNMIKLLLNYIISTKKEKITGVFLSRIENIMHIGECNIDVYLGYSIDCLLKHLKGSDSGL